MRQKKSIDKCSGPGCICFELKKPRIIKKTIHLTNGANLIVASYPGPSPSPLVDVMRIYQETQAMLRRERTRRFYLDEIVEGRA